MKRKVMLVALAVILCSLVVVSGTLAYYTITGRNENQVSMGNIAIQLNDEYTPQYNLVPNPNQNEDALISKKISVTNEGKGDAFVMIKVKKEWSTAIPSEDDKPLATDNIVLNIDETYWQKLTDSGNAQNGYECYYYRYPLKAGKTTQLLMDGFYFMPLSEVGYQGDLVDNDYKGLTAHIDVQAFAVQAASAEGALAHEWGVIYDEQAHEFDRPTELSAENGEDSGNE